MQKDIFNSLTKEKLDLLDKNPIIKNMLNDFFKSYGFKSLKIVNNKKFNEVVEKDLTIYNSINFTDLESLKRNSDFYQCIPDNTDFYPCTYQKYNEGLNIVTKYSDTPIAVYFEDRNILYLTFDILVAVQRENNKYIYDIILKELKIHFDKIKFKKVNINDFVERQVFKKLKSNIENNIINCKNDLRNNELSIESYSKELLNYNKKRFELITALQNYDDINKNFDKNIRDSLKEVKGLKFIKSFKFAPEGIKFHFGKLSFEDNIYNEDGSTSKVKCYLGDYTLTLGTSYSIDNKDFLIVGDSKYHHMHKGSSTCWGDYATEIPKLIAEFKYKQLCMLIYSWLKSFNPNDNIISFRRYYQARQIEGKFDENGKILKSYEKPPKVVEKEIRVGVVVRLKTTSEYYSSQARSIGNSRITKMEYDYEINRYNFRFDNGYSNSYLLTDLEVVE